MEGFRKRLPAMSKQLTATGKLLDAATDEFCDAVSAAGARPTAANLARVAECRKRLHAIRAAHDEERRNLRAMTRLGKIAIQM